VRLGDRLFALKLYDDGGYFNDQFFFDTLAGSDVPVPCIHARGEAGAVVDRPWLLMDWLAGNQRITDEGGVAHQLGWLARQIHAIPVSGAGGRRAGGWEFASWHELVEVDSRRDRGKVDRFGESGENERLLRSVVDEFLRAARLQPADACLLHGDLGLDNTIIQDDRVVGLIDSGWFIGGDPLLDVAYLMIHPRLGAGEAKRRFFQGYGAPELEGSRDLQIFRAYHLLGKMIHCHSVGARERYEQRRSQLLALAAQLGLV
jgi:aminoglycoside phosphotransferase (APT) family kinase protein